jgi:N-acyl-D-amino-acid deacylase
MFDILVRGGTIVDGSGQPAFASDIGINGDRKATVNTWQ